jgi:hypothetical protein
MHDYSIKRLYRYLFRHVDRWRWRPAGKRATNRQHRLHALALAHARQWAAHVGIEFVWVPSDQFAEHDDEDDSPLFTPRRLWRVCAWYDGEPLGELDRADFDGRRPTGGCDVWWLEAELSLEIMHSFAWATESTRLC